MEILTGQRIEELLAAVGELLQQESHSCSIVVVGGASLNLLGLLERTTKDVDVVARVEKKGGRRIFVQPDPLPEPLEKAIATVARDFGLPTDWMNTRVATQWPQGLPKFLFEEERKGSELPRESQRHRERCRALAAHLWECDPQLTIADMIHSDAINRHGCENHIYGKDALRDWIKDLRPNRRPGRRPEK